MKPVIKAVALDKDGVIFDTERLIYRAFRELIVRERLPIRPELFEELVGKPPQVYLQVLNEALGQAMSLDDFIITHFTKGAGIDTLSTLIYSQVRRGIVPSMYALSAIIFAAVLLLLLVANFMPSAKNSKQV